MKIATYNVNGVNGRLPVLLHWLETARPDVVCLQELKAQQANFPTAAIRDAGYGAVWLGQKSWNGVAILARGAEIHETRRALPGDPDPTQSRYIEAAVNGVLVGCLYLPNGNPAPGPKFDYKLHWLEAFKVHAAALMESGAPVVLAGDYNVIPTDLDVYKPERWREDALFRPEVRNAYASLLGLDGRLAYPASRREYLYLLGLFPERLRPGCWAKDRPPAPQSLASGSASGGRGGSSCPSLGKNQRSRPGLDPVKRLGSAGLQMKIPY